MNKIASTNQSLINRISAKLMFISMILFFVFPTYAQETEINKVDLQITCSDVNGNAVNTGLGTYTVNGSPTYLLSDADTASNCTSLAIELLLSQLDATVITELFGEQSTTESNSDNTVADPSSGSSTSSFAQIGTPVGPIENFALDCDNREATTNGVRITAYLPAGDYRVVLLPGGFQAFDPILFVDTGTERLCSSESRLAREYVVDFSGAGIGEQIYGNDTGGALEFNVDADATDLVPVEIVFGGQDRSDIGTSGEFALIIEGARLTPQANTHIYNVAITESLFNSDIPLSAIVLGVNEITDPNLKANAIVSETETVTIFECEDSSGSCDSDARRSLKSTTVVEAAVRTVVGDDLDAALLKQPGAYLALGIQEVSFFVSEIQDDTVSREEYVIIFYGGID